jgi:hypothetical protein
MAALALLCAACGQQPGAADKAPAGGKATPPEVARTPRLFLAGNGLELVHGAGAARPVAFGTPEGAARAQIEPVTGAPAARTDEPACGGRPRIRLDYPGGLSLIFQAGRFVAWGQDAGAGYKMRSGIAIESPRAALRALGPVALRRVNVTDVPLEEFTAGPVSGVLLGGKVQDLAAGESACR